MSHIVPEKQNQRGYDFSTMIGYWEIFQSEKSSQSYEGYHSPNNLSPHLEVWSFWKTEPIHDSDAGQFFTCHEIKNKVTFVPGISWQKLDRIQETWVGRWETRPQCVGGTSGSVLSPCHQSLRGCVLHWPWLWGRGTRVVEKLFHGLLGMTSKTQEGLPEFPWEAPFTAVWEWEILIVI